MRWIYGFPDFPPWLARDLPNLKPGRLNAADPPQEQVDNIFYRWITGKEIIYSRQFQDLLPMADEVWEMKTADIRIFGWMYRPLKFIAVFGDYADLYKGSKKTRTYEAARRRVVAERDRLNLDAPKLATGTFDELVSI
ncbi:MAG: hypothetical protein WB764_17170 [Xanthobacteraceae bacterium]